MKRDTITTTFYPHQQDPRVRFSCPDEGYSIDDLDALAVAIGHARRKLLEQQPATTDSLLPNGDLAAAFREQQTRMAAPS